MEATAFSDVNIEPANAIYVVCSKYLHACNKIFPVTFVYFPSLH